MNGIFDTYLSAHSTPAHAQPVPVEPGRFPTADEQARQATHDAEEKARIDAAEVIPGADQRGGKTNTNNGTSC